MFPKSTTPEKAIEFLQGAEKYFKKKPTNGEDRAYWSNVSNANNCKNIAELIKSMDGKLNGQ